MPDFVKWLHRGFRQPEFNVVLFGFLVNLPWEFLQVPFFRQMAAAPHWPP